MAVTLLARLNCARLGASFLNYLGPYTIVKINGLLFDAFAIVKNSMRIDLGLNSTPSTASLRLTTKEITLHPVSGLFKILDNTQVLRPAPAIGMPVTITNGVDLFGGSITRVTLVATDPAAPLAGFTMQGLWAWDVECQDALWLLRGTPIWKRYSSSLYGDTLQSAIKDCVGTVAGVTTIHVQNIGLSTGSSFDITFSGESVASALAKLINLSNGAWYRFDAASDLHVWSAAVPDVGQTNPSVLNPLPSLGRGFALTSDGTQQRATVLAKGPAVTTMATWQPAGSLALQVDSPSFFPFTTPRASGDYAIASTGAVFTAPYLLGAQAAAAPSISTTGGGVVDVGQHIWGVTYGDDVGETALSTLATDFLVFTVGSPISVTLLIPISPYSGTKRRNIYRTKSGTSSPFLLVGTVNDNSTTTFTDNIADASLGAAAPATGTNLLTLNATALSGPTNRAIAIGSRITYLYSTGGFPGSVPSIVTDLSSALTFTQLLTEASAILGQFGSAEAKAAFQCFDPYAVPGRVVTNARLGDRSFWNTFVIQKTRIDQFGLAQFPAGVPLQVYAGTPPRRSVEASVTRFGLADFLSSVGG